jgi:acyl-CoA synthetase
LARRYYAEWLWRKDTLYTLLCDHAARRPEAFAVRDSRRRLSWGELRGVVDAVAADLDEAGLKRGERVSVCLPNRVEAVAILLACSRQGYVCNPSLHQNYTVGEITELLSRIRAAAFFAEPGYGADARTADIFAAAAALPSLRRIYTLGTGPLSAAPFPKVALAPSLPPADNDPDKIVYLAFTSGTTGTPKGCHAFGQHLAGKWPSGCRLASRAHDLLSLSR